MDFKKNELTTQVAESARDFGRTVHTSTYYGMG